MIDNQLKKCCEKCKKGSLAVAKNEEGVCVWCAFQETCREYKKWCKYTNIIKESMERADKELMENITSPDMSMERKVIQEILEKDAKRQKPPLGTVPNWLVLPQRIADLSGAIIRSAESDQMSTDAIREWAQEIICHCNTMDELEKKRANAPGFKGGKIPKFAKGGTLNC